MYDLGFFVQSNKTEAEVRSLVSTLKATFAVSGMDLMTVVEELKYPKETEDLS